MNQHESPFERVAKQLNENANRISKGRTGTDSISEICYCLEEEVIGVYPQAVPSHSNNAFVDDGYLYFDRFPEPVSDPIELRLEDGAKWTDVLTASLRYRCFLVNSKALEIFKQFNLGNTRFYDAVVSCKNEEPIEYTYIFLCNHVTEDDVDFARSECFLVDMLGQPIREISITDQEDFNQKTQEAQDGNLPGSEPFCLIAIGKVQLLSGHVPQADIFGMSHLDTRIYVSAPLRDALLDAELSGLDFKQNTRLFF